MYSPEDDPKGPGCPIRTFLDQSLLAAPQDFSQPVTSFIASRCQGIHQMLLSHLIISTHREQRRRQNRPPKFPELSNVRGKTQFSKLRSKKPTLKVRRMRDRQLIPGRANRRQGVQAPGWAQRTRIEARYLPPAPVSYNKGAGIRRYRSIPDIRTITPILIKAIIPQIHLSKIDGMVCSKRTEDNGQPASAGSLSAVFRSL